MLTPAFLDLEAFNARLVEHCRRDPERRRRGREACKAVLLAEERSVFIPLPDVPFRAESTFAR